MNKRWDKLLRGDKVFERIKAFFAKFKKKKEE